MLSNQLCACGCGEYTDIVEKTDSRRGQVKGQPMKYRPNHSPTSAALRRGPTPTLELPRIDALALREMTDEAAAIQGDQWARFIDGMDRISFAQKGMLAYEFKLRALWSHVGFKDFTSWVEGSMPFSASSVFQAAKCVEQLMESRVPAAKILEMPRVNLVKMAKGILSDSVRRDPEVIEAAIHSNGKDFTQKIVDEFPEQHVEPEEWVRFPMAISKHTLVVGIMAKFGFTAWEQFILTVAVEYDASHEPEEAHG